MVQATGLVDVDRESELNFRSGLLLTQATLCSVDQMMTVDEDAWLSGIFGCPVWRVTIPAKAEARAQPLTRELLQQRAVRGRAFFFMKIPVADVDLLRNFQGAGFSVVETNVQFAREPAETDEEPGPIVVRDARPVDRMPIADIASSCFRYSRFHLDPLITKSVAHAIKRAWVESYFDGRRGERLLIAEKDGVPVGFLAVLASLQESGQTHWIDLMGVRGDQQGKGVGRRLVKTFVGRFRDQDTSLGVGTQAANVPSIRLYENCGFRFTGAWYVLHAHVEDGRLRK